MLSVAFFTLFEVKLLGGFHLRLGPDRVGVFGYLQPFGDFVKLFFRGLSFSRRGVFLLFNSSSFISLLLGLFIWVLYCGDFPYYSFL